jgi:hypothetical protein
LQLAYVPTNTESDADLKIKAMKIILERICEKYKKVGDPTFTQEEVIERLRGLGPTYVDLNIRDLFRGSGFIDIDDNYNLTLNENGRKSCKKGEFQY